MIRKYAEIFCWKNVSSFCSAKATQFFSAKNIRILYIESAKTVNKMTLNELVKLTMLRTTGPRAFSVNEKPTTSVNHENFNVKCRWWASMFSPNATVIWSWVWWWRVGILHLSTLFKSYQDDEGMVLKGSVQEVSYIYKMNFASSRILCWGLMIWAELFKANIVS